MQCPNELGIKCGQHATLVSKAATHVFLFVDA